MNPTSSRYVVFYLVRPIEEIMDSKYPFNTRAKTPSQLHGRYGQYKYDAVIILKSNIKTITIQFT